MTRQTRDDIRCGRTIILMWRALCAKRGRMGVLFLRASASDLRDGAASSRD